MTDRPMTVKEIGRHFDQRCDHLSARLDDVTATLQHRADKAESQLEDLEETSMPELYRKVNDWGVVFEEMANRISTLEQMVLRLTNREGQPSGEGSTWSHTQPVVVEDQEQ